MYPKPSQLLPQVDRGFALIISLSLMSLVVLMLFTLSALVRVESQKKSSARAVFTARANAHLGFQIALGNLQRLAGPDQRVTAEADILETVASVAAVEPLAKGGNRRWTGVWSSESGDFLGYLLSGLGRGLDLDDAENFSAALTIDGTSTDNDLAVLVGAGSTDVDAGFVAVPLEECPVRGNSPSGRYGWWVGDQGTDGRANRKPWWRTGLPPPNGRRDRCWGSKLGSAPRFFQHPGSTVREWFECDCGHARNGRRHGCQRTGSAAYATMDSRECS